MWDNFIGAAIQRANRNLAIVNVVIVAIIAIAGLASLEYYRDFFSGPYALSTAEVQAANSLSDFSHKWVTLQTDGIYQKIARLTTNSKPTADFSAFSVGSRFVIAKTDIGASAPTLTGVLRTPDSDERKEIFDDPLTNKVLQGQMLPLILDTKEDFRSNGYIGLVIGIPLLLLGVWNLVRVLQRSTDPGRHPSARALERFGDPAQAAAAIDMQARNPAGQTTFKNVRVLPSWLVRTTALGVDVLRLDEIVWVYKKVTQTRYGKSFSLVIANRNKKTLELSGKEPEVEEIGTDLARRAPWILVGYNKELETAWKSNPTGVIQAVDQRRAQAGAAPTAAATPVAEMTPPNPMQ